MPSRFLLVAFACASLGVAGCSKIIGVAPGRAAPSEGANSTNVDVTNEDRPTNPEGRPTADETVPERPLETPAFAALEDGAAWSSFDVREADPAARNFQSAVFDGRFVYFVPNYGPDTPSGARTRSGLVVRYDSRKSLDDKAAWEKFDTSSQFAGTRGFTGGVFDGRFVYLVPYGWAFNTPLNGKVVRIDTNGSFTDPSTWSMFDVNAANLGNDAVIGFGGATFDGRYVYFVPYSSYTQRVGFAVRYDTTANFASATSWQGVDVPALKGEPRARGYNTAGFDGRYVYFVPSDNFDGSPHGVLARYDTRKPFDGEAAWEVADLASFLGPDVVGLWGAIFDGRYMYFPPHRRMDAVRYDTTKPLLERSSYATVSLGDDFTVFAGGTFDGRFVYFAPSQEPNGGPVIRRYDTLGAFDDPAAWTALKTGSRFPGSGGFAGAVFDGTSVYFVPARTGHLLRFRARREPISPFPVSSFY